MSGDIAVKLIVGVGQGQIPSTFRILRLASAAGADVAEVVRIKALERRGALFVRIGGEFADGEDRDDAIDEVGVNAIPGAGRSLVLLAVFGRHGHARANRLAERSLGVGALVADADGQGRPLIEVRTGPRDEGNRLVAVRDILRARRQHDDRGRVREGRGLGTRSAGPEIERALFVIDRIDVAGRVERLECEEFADRRAERDPVDADVAGWLLRWRNRGRGGRHRSDDRAFARRPTRHHGDREKVEEAAHRPLYLRRHAHRQTIRGRVGNSTNNTLWIVPTWKPLKIRI